MIAKAYGNFLVKTLNKEINFDTDTIKCMLCNATYSPDQDAHIYKNQVTNEITGTAYVAGGTTVSNTTMTYTAGTNKIKLDGDDVTWAASTITARYAVLYDDTPATDATKPLICYLDFESDQISSNGEFKITFSTNGIVEITVA